MEAAFEAEEYSRAIERALTEPASEPLVNIEEQAARLLVLPPYWTEATLAAALTVGANTLVDKDVLRPIEESSDYLVVDAFRHRAARLWSPADLSERIRALEQLGAQLAEHATGRLELWAKFASLAGAPVLFARTLDQLTAGASTLKAILDGIEVSRTIVDFLGQGQNGELELALRRASRRAELANRQGRDERALTGYLERPALDEPVKRLLTDPAPGAWALHLIGSGGVGKTMQVRHIAQRVRRECNALVARVDFDFLSPDFPTRAPGLLLWALAQDLRVADVERLAESYWTTLEEIVSKLHARIASEGHWLASDPDFIEAIQIFRSAVRGLSRTGSSPRPVLLILDTCEELNKVDAGRTPKNLEAAFDILERIRSGYDEQPLSEIRVVFAGRRPLASRGSNFNGGPATLKPRNYLSVLPIYGFDAAEATRFLQKSKVPDELIQPVLSATAEQSVSPGLDTPGAKSLRHMPFDLTLFAAWATEHDGTLPSTEELGQAHGDAYVRLRVLARLNDETLTSALPILTRLGHCDEVLLTYLFGDDRGSELAEALRNQEWCETRSVIDASANTNEVLSVHPSILNRLENYYGPYAVGPEVLTRAAEGIRRRFLEDAAPLDVGLLAAALRALAASPAQTRAFMADIAPRIAALGDDARVSLFERVGGVLTESRVYDAPLGFARTFVRLTLLAWSAWDRTGPVVADWEQLLAEIATLSGRTSPDEIAELENEAIAGRLIAASRDGVARPKHAAALCHRRWKAPEPLCAAVWAAADFVLMRASESSNPLEIARAIQDALLESSWGYHPSASFFRSLARYACTRLLSGSAPCFKVPWPAFGGSGPWLRHGVVAQDLYALLLGLEHGQSVQELASLIAASHGYRRLFEQILALRTGSTEVRPVSTGVADPKLDRFKQGCPHAWSFELPVEALVSAETEVAAGLVGAALARIAAVPLDSPQLARQVERARAAVIRRMRLFYGGRHEIAAALHESPVPVDMLLAAEVDGLKGRPIESLPRISPALPLSGRLACFHSLVRSLHRVESREFPALNGWIAENAPLPYPFARPRELADQTLAAARTEGHTFETTLLLDFLELHRLGADVASTEDLLAPAIEKLTREQRFGEEAFAQRVRAAALLEGSYRAPSDEEALSLGLRRAASVALSEGEALNLRAPRAASSLLAQAARWFNDAGDHLGEWFALTAFALATPTAADSHRLFALSAELFADLDFRYLAEKPLRVFECGLPGHDEVVVARAALALASVSIRVAHADALLEHWPVPWPQNPRIPAELWQALGHGSVSRHLDEHSTVLQLQPQGRTHGARASRSGLVRATSSFGGHDYTFHADPREPGWGLTGQIPPSLLSERGNEMVIAPHESIHGPCWEALLFQTIADTDRVLPVRRIAFQGFLGSPPEFRATPRVAVLCSHPIAGFADSMWGRYGQGAPAGQSPRPNLVHLFGYVIETERLVFVFDEKLPSSFSADEPAALDPQTLKDDPSIQAVILQGLPLDGSWEADAISRTRSALQRQLAAVLAFRVPLVLYVPALPWDLATVVCERISSRLCEVGDAADMAVFVGRLRAEVAEKSRGYGQRAAEWPLELGVYCMNGWVNPFKPNLPHDPRARTS